MAVGPESARVPGTPQNDERRTGRILTNIWIDGVTNSDHLGGITQESYCRLLRGHELSEKAPKTTYNRHHAALRDTRAGASIHLQVDAFLRSQPQPLTGIAIKTAPLVRLGGFLLPAFFEKITKYSPSVTGVTLHPRLLTLVIRCNPEFSPSNQKPQPVTRLGFCRSTTSA